MDYPSDFPPHAQAKVTAAKVRASQDLADASKNPPNQWEDAAIRYVMSIFGAFAHQACELGKVRLWTVARIEAEANDFLWKLASRAPSECEERGIQIWGMLSSPGLASIMSASIYRSEPPPRPIKPRILQAFKSSPEWMQFQAELLEVADFQATRPQPVLPVPPTVEPAAPPQPEPAPKKREYRAPNLDLLKNQNVSLSRLNAAAALGISVRTLDRWIGDGKLRPVASGKRKRFKVNNLKKMLEQMELDRRDIT